MANLILDEVEVPEELKFLLVEDEEHFQAHMHKSLINIGFSGNFEKAYDIETAIKMAGKSKYEFIFSDWNLPDAKGIDFLKAVRAESAYDHCPFVMVTTMDEIQDILDATSEGSDGYIVKPYNEVDLINTLSFAYKKRKRS